MENNMEIDLHQVFKVLKKRVWIIILCAVLVAATTLFYTVGFVTPKYQASVTMYVNNNSSKTSDSVSANDLSVALRLVSTYVNIVTSDRVLNRVVEETGLSLSASQIRGMVSAHAEGETEMFRVTVTSTNPRMSADIANTIAKVSPEVIADIIEGSSAKIIDEAKVPQHQSSPNYISSAMLGAIVGAALSVLAFVIQCLLDARVKSEEDLRRICDVPVLGMIPNLATDAMNTGKKVRK